MVRALWLSVVLSCAAAPLAAQGCRLALLLALDVSSSVDAREYALQRDGLAAALSDPAIETALLAGDAAVAIAVMEWSGRRQSTVVQGWRLLQTAGDLRQVVATVRAAQRSHADFPTAMGYAMGFAATFMRQAPDCARKVIDVSGDGVTNDGFGPELAYRHFPFDGIVVNGLAVLGADPRVEAYYRDRLRHGPGAFVETAEGYEGYRRAMTRKLFREIGHVVLGQANAPEAPG